MRDHTKLRAFTLADDLVLAVYRVTQSFPGYEQFGLANQMRRAAISAASNIVEGCARSTEADYLRFLDMAFGSCRELAYQATVAARLGYISAEDSTSLGSLATETCKTLNGLIRSLRRQTSR